MHIAFAVFTVPQELWCSMSSTMIRNLQGTTLRAGHAEQDTFVSKAHSERLHKAYAGDKNLITFEGDHNSHRPQFFYSSVLIFLSTVLQLDEPMPEQEAAKTAATAGRCVACPSMPCMKCSQ